MADFEYKYFYIHPDDAPDNSYFQCMVTLPNFGDNTNITEYEWNDVDERGLVLGPSPICIKNPLNQVSFSGNPGYGSFKGKKCWLCKRDGNNRYIESSYAFKWEDGIANDTRTLTWYYNSSVLDTVEFTYPTSDMFIASTYGADNAYLNVARLCAYNNNTGNYVMMDLIPTVIKDFLNGIESTNPDKRYYYYETNAVRLGDSEFIITDISSLNNITPAWDGGGGYLKDSTATGWVIGSSGTVDEVIERLHDQDDLFRLYYNDDRIRLGTNFLYRNAGGGFINGMGVIGSTYDRERDVEYTVNAGKLTIKWFISSDINHEASYIKFFVDGVQRDIFTFKTITNPLFYGGSAYTWAGNHTTDNLFLARYNGEYCICGRTCRSSAMTTGDGSSVMYPFYFTVFKSLSTEVGVEISREEVTESVVEYTPSGTEIEGNETVEKGVVDGESGTWYDTNNNGVIDEGDTFVPDRTKRQTGTRGENDGSTNINDGNDDITSTPDKPTLQPTTSGMVCAYKLNSAELTTLSNELMTPTAWGKFKAFFSVNPLDGIYSLHMLPYDVTTSLHGRIKIGDWNSTNDYSIIDDIFPKKNLGEVKIKEVYQDMEYLNYTDVDVKIFLPFIGYKDLSPENVIGVTTRLEYITNVLTGEILATLYCDGKPLYQWTGSAIIKLPLSREDYSTAISNGIHCAVSIGSAIANFSTGNVTSGVSGLVSAGDSLVKASKPNLITSGTISGNASFFTGKQAFYIITRNTVDFNKNFPHEFGRHSYTRKTIGSLKGFTKVIDVDLENLTCTQEEKDEIRSVMKEGFYV